MLPHADSMGASLSGRTMSALTPVLALLLASPAEAQWVEDSIDVGGAWVGDMVYNAESDVVYGCSNSGDFVFAISCATNQVVSQVAAFYAGGLAYSSTSRKLYCSFGYPGDSVLVVSGVTHQRLKAIPLSEANQMVWDSVNNCVYVSRTDDDAVSVIDCATDLVVDSIPTDYGPVNMHLNALHHKLYVLNFDAESVTIVDLGSHEVTGTIPVMWPPQVGCYSAAVDKYYCGSGRQVTVVDGQADTVVRRLTIGSGAGATSMVAVDPHRVVMVGGCGGTSAEDTVFVIDAVADTLVRALPTMSGPQGMCWSPLTDLVYVAATFSDRLAVVEGDGSQVRRFFHVGEDPYVLLPVARHERLYVGHFASDMVYVVKDRAGGIEESASGEVRRANWVATVVGDVLRLPGLAGHEPDAPGGIGSCPCLLDATGRRVMELAPGENDVAHLAPGVYFVRGAQGSSGKVVIP